MDEGAAATHVGRTGKAVGLSCPAPASGIPVRKAAIHGLGRLGGPEDRALLEALGADNRNLAEATNPARPRFGR